MSDPKGLEKDTFICNPSVTQPMPLYSFCAVVALLLNSLPRPLEYVIYLALADQAENGEHVLCS